MAISRWKGVVKQHNIQSRMILVLSSHLRLGFQTGLYSLVDEASSNDLGHRPLLTAD
jgi:hypothetical protein